MLDLAVIGAGPCGLAVGVAAKRARLTCSRFDKGPVASSLMRYPLYMTSSATPDKLEMGVPCVTAGDKPTRREALTYYRKVAEHFELDVRQYHTVLRATRTRDGFELVAQHPGSTEPETVSSRHLVFATGYFESPNPLRVPGEDLPHVSHFFVEPHPYWQQRVVVVGGGNSGVEAALELCRVGARVTMVHFLSEFDRGVKPWILPDITNRLKEGRVAVRWCSRVVEIRRSEVLVRRDPDADGETIPADFVLALTGYTADLSLLRSVGVAVNETSGVPPAAPRTTGTNLPGAYIPRGPPSRVDGNKIIIAPAAFKGTLGPRQVADAMAVGARRALPDAAVLQCPISDGGDGLLDVVLPPGSLRERLSVTGPLGEPVSGELGWVDPEMAIFESATACGIALLKPEQLDPLRATTRGVGELIWEAAERGAKTAVVGLGGSATVDGGTGQARGLGWAFLDATGAPLPEGGGSLAQLAEFDGGWGLAARVIALADVTTPLVGSRGAAPVFGPQKGAGPEGVKLLSRGLERLAELIARHGRGDLATLLGGGAAGGLGAGLVCFAKAQLTGGAEWVLARVGFDAALAKAQLVITGEGCFDKTSLVGKASGEVVRRAQGAKTRVAVVAGKVESLGRAHALDRA